MKNTVKDKIIILILMVLPAISVAGGEWDLIVDKDGITLYAREVSGHSEAQFKGVCMVGRPLESVGFVLSDIASYPKWFFKCIEAKKIPAEDSTPFQFFLYVAIDTPWPFSDRDVVYKTEVSIDYTSGKVVVHSIALKTPLMPLRRRYVLKEYLLPVPALHLLIEPTLGALLQIFYRIPAFATQRFTRLKI
jgi:hypothetical protein